MCTLKLFRRATTPFMWCSRFWTGPSRMGFFRSIIGGPRRRFGPKSSRWAPVGQSICSSDEPRNSRSSSASGARYPRSEWVVSMPSWMFMPGLSDSSLTRRRMIAWSAACWASFATRPQDDRLVGRLLGVLRDQHRPARVEGGVEVVVAAMDVQRVLCQRPGAYLEHHCRELSRRVVVLLHRIDDALPGGEIDRPPALHGIGRCAPLGGVLALRLDGHLLLPPHVQFTLGVGLLVDLAALGRGGDRVEYPAFGDPRLHMLGDQLVAVAGDADARVLRFLPGRGMRARGRLLRGCCGGAHGRRVYGTGISTWSVWSAWDD